MRAVWLMVMMTAFPAMASGDEACDRLVAALPHLSGGAPLKVKGTGDTYKSLFDGCDAGNGYDRKPLPVGHNGERPTCSDQNMVAYLDRYPDGTINFSAKAAVDADGSPVGCGSGWPNQCGTWLTFDHGSAHPDVNAEETPFVVVPGNFVYREDKKPPVTLTSFQSDTHIRAGDLAVAVWDGKCSFGVVGDSGPYFRLGEISLRSHVEFDNDQCEVKGQHPCQKISHHGNGESIPSDVHYLIFPHSRPKPLLSQNVNDVSGKLARMKADKFIKDFSKDAASGHR